MYWLPGINNKAVPTAIKTANPKTSCMATGNVREGSVYPSPFEADCPCFLKGDSGFSRLCG